MTLERDVELARALTEQLSEGRSVDAPPGWIRGCERALSRVLDRIEAVDPTAVPSHMREVARGEGEPDAEYVEPEEEAPVAEGSGVITFRDGSTARFSNFQVHFTPPDDEHANSHSVPLRLPSPFSELANNQARPWTPTPPRTWEREAFNQARVEFNDEVARQREAAAGRESRELYESVLDQLESLPDLPALSIDDLRQRLAQEEESARVRADLETHRAALQALVDASQADRWEIPARVVSMVERLAGTTDNLSEMVAYNPDILSERSIAEFAQEIEQAARALRVELQGPPETAKPKTRERDNSPVCTERFRGLLDNREEDA